MVRLVSDQQYALVRVVSFCGLGLLCGLWPGSSFAQVPPAENPTEPLPTLPLPSSPRVSDLVDVSPTDWAYEAVQRLHSNYGCLAGYPDNTFRGDQPLTRYEFAAALNACIAAIGVISDPTIYRLLEEFDAELTALEAEVETLEAQQFSTTTRLFGQAIIGLQVRSSNTADFFPRDGVRETEDPGAGDVNLISTVDLTLITNFDEKSFLVTGLQAGEGSTFPSLSNDTRLGFEADTNNSVRVSELSYRRLLNDKLALIVGSNGVTPVLVFRGPNRIASAGLGPVSAFAQRNPVINLGNTTAGVGLDWQFARSASLQAVYSAGTDVSDANAGGVFGSDYTAGAQVLLTPTDELDISLYYLHSYSTSGRLGTGVGDDQVVAFTGAASPLSTDALGASLNWRITPTLDAGLWGGYTHSTVPGVEGAVATVNWMLSLSLLDLFAEGNVGGIYLGQPPRIIRSDLQNNLNIPGLLKDLSGDPGGQLGATTHFEIFYRMSLQENIYITPGFIATFAPGNSPDSDTILTGVLRTTFRF